MARTLVYRIQFNASNPEGTYVAGDTVDVYYDPDNDPLGPDPTAGYEVELNGTVVTSGSDISFLEKSYKTTQFFVPFICNGTTAVSASPLRSAFPYVFSVGFANYPGCAINPVTCDLIFVGTPTIIGASSDIASDGEITVVAESTNPIQYKLNEDFSYGDGTGQSDGHFFVTAGSYRVYVRDSKNCFANIYVTVPVDNSYSPIYTLEYTDRLDNRTKIEVQKRSFDGDTTVVKGGDLPFELRLMGVADNNKFTAILPTEATLVLISEVNFQFQDLFTNSQKEYRIAYFKDFGQSLPSFTPASLNALNLWTAVAGARQWSFVSGAWKILLALDQTSLKLYTLYSFTAGETYTFDYALHATTGDGDGKYRIKITNASGADLGIAKTITFHGTTSISDSLVFVAPSGADRIEITAYNASDHGDHLSVTFFVDSFTNVTPSHGGMPIGYELKWVGNVLPQQYQEAYMAPPYPVSILAKDGLTDLKNIDFLQDDGQQFFGRVKAITLISYCLKKTLLDLPIRCGCNIYAEDMDQTDTDDPLDQAYIDPDAYYLQGNPTFEFVLQEILKVFRARIIQWDNRWNIVRPEEMVDAYDYRDFDVDGVFIANGTYDPVKNVNSPQEGSSLKWTATPNMELRPGYGKARIIYHLGLKDNILRNGNFRLKALFNSLGGTYSYAIDKFGFQLVSPYAVSEGAEILDSANVAYKMSSDSIATSGEAYIQSDIYPVAMGANNTLKIKIRYKVPFPVRLSLAIDDDGFLQVIYLPAPIRYQKVRMVVQYDDLYLQTNGTWTPFYSELIFYVTQFGEYVESEVIASQPDSSFTSEKDFQAKVFHSWANHMEYHAIADLKAKVTGFGNNRGNYDASSNLFPSTGGSGGGGSILQGDKWGISVAGVLGGQAVIVGYTIVAVVNTPGQTAANWFISNSTIQALPTGTKTELELTSGLIYYYELEENTDANDESSIIRPNDYHVANNPVQWIFKGLNDLIQNPKIEFFIDYISVQFLVDGKEAIDTIIRQQNGEPRNNLVSDEEVFHGSLSSVLESNMVQGIQQFKDANIFQDRFKNIFPRVTNFTVIENVLSGKLIFTGFFSDENGEGYENWTRDGIVESTTLHQIFLSTVVGQYSRSYRKITGGLTGDIYLGLIDSIREVQQEGLIYLPMSITLNDKDNIYSNCELLELLDIFEDSGAGYTIGFSLGYDS